MGGLEGDEEGEGREGDVTLWTVGGESDDDELPSRRQRRQNKIFGNSGRGERASLIKVGEGDEERSINTPSPSDLRDPFRDEPEQFELWETEGGKGKGKSVQ